MNRDPKKSTGHHKRNDPVGKQIDSAWESYAIYTGTRAKSYLRNAPKVFKVFKVLHNAKPPESVAMLPQATAAVNASHIAASILRNVGPGALAPVAPIVRDTSDSDRSVGVRQKWCLGEKHCLNTTRGSRARHWTLM
jgi:hypothetical protein